MNRDLKTPLSGDRETKYHSSRGILPEKWRKKSSKIPIRRRRQYGSVESLAGQLIVWLVIYWIPGGFFVFGSWLCSPARFWRLVVFARSFRFDSISFVSFGLESFQFGLNRFDTFRFAHLYVSIPFVSFRFVSGCFASIRFSIRFVSCQSVVFRFGSFRVDPFRSGLVPFGPSRLGSVRVDSVRSGWIRFCSIQ